MSDSKHTAGPWRVEQDTTLIWGDCNPDDATSYGMGYPIAECRVTPSGSWAKGPKGHSEADANARLIAAAPDLLEALKAAMAFIDSHVADADITDKMARNHCRLRETKPHDAIARAEGR